MLKDGNSYSNTLVDSRTSFVMFIYAGNAGTTSSIQNQTIKSTTISTTGQKLYTFTANENYNNIRIKHSGSNRDINVDYECNLIAGKTYTISFNLTGINPSVVGGLSWNSVQVEKGLEATDYVPYGCIGIKKVNKNKLITSTCVGGWFNTSGTFYSSGVSSFNINGNKITVTTTDIWRGFVSDFIECKPNTNYKVSYKTEETGLTTTQFYCFYDKNKQNGSRNQTGLAPANAKYMRVYVGVSTATTVHYYDIQLEERKYSNRLCTTRRKNILLPI